VICISCKQGTPEWAEARLGVITASRCKDACDRLKSGAFSAKALGYAAMIALERIARESCDDTFVNFAMRRGTELEPDARFAYENRTGHVVMESGFVTTDDSAFGYSTDGFVGADGAVEIKCPLSPLTVISMWSERDLSEYMHQIQMGLWITGRKWIDFVMFDPRLRSVQKDLFIERVHRNDRFIEEMEEQLLGFKSLVDLHESRLRADSKAA
jgi:hypothetical protein